jgi:adenylate cyclase
MLFDSQSFLINFSSPAVAVLLTFVAIIVYRAMTEERDKKRTLETFGKYVSPDVADVLVEGEMPSLGGTDKMITVFFSDIRGFTSLSETMSPQELVNHLNIYLTEMTNIIMLYQGTLDKYVGDEVMCYWGAPLDQEEHASLACKCALRQMSRLRELNESWPENRRINIGIGLNSGIMTWGNMGSPLRMNITLMGDNVNLGARLEGTNKEYGTNIIISENTFSLVKDKFIVRELDNIRVKGKSKPVLMYELVDCLESMDPPAPKKAKK